MWPFYKIFTCAKYFHTLFFFIVNRKMQNTHTHTQHSKHGKHGCINLNDRSLSFSFYLLFLHLSTYIQSHFYVFMQKMQKNTFFRFFVFIQQATYVGKCLFVDLQIYIYIMPELCSFFSLSHSPLIFFSLIFSSVLAFSPLNVSL
jgi:hypothetical protein